MSAPDPCAAKHPLRVAALYRFTPFDDPASLREVLLAVCLDAKVCGTLILAREGINGTIAGTDDGIDQVLAHIRTLPGCAGLAVRNSRAAAMPFGRMKVRVKPEIVTMGVPGTDPLADAGHYVAPEAWNALISDPETVLIDTRNAYEVAQGSFPGAIDPGTRHFRDFPAWFRAHRATLLAGKKAPRIAMFCTGGIRCEKATAFVRNEGFEEVFHLQGGILAYLERVAPEQSRWNGSCFVFDERAGLAHGLALAPPAHDPSQER